MKTYLHLSRSQKKTKQKTVPAVFLFWFSVAAQTTQIKDRGLFGAHDFLAAVVFVTFSHRGLESGCKGHELILPSTGKKRTGLCDEYLL